MLKVPDTLQKERKCQTFRESTQGSSARHLSGDILSAKMGSARHLGGRGKTSDTALVRHLGGRGKRLTLLWSWCHSTQINAHAIL